MPWPADLAPLDLKQPDQRSCGAASVVAARVVLTDWRPGDAAREILDEHRLLTSSRSPRDRFQVPWPRRLGTPPWAVANALRTLTGQRIATVNARPRPAIGYEVLRETLATRPGAVLLPCVELKPGRHSFATEMIVMNGVDGDLFKPGDRAAARAELGLPPGPVAVYVGSRWLPRHVVLALGTVGDAVEVFDPAAGATVTLGRARWAEHRLGFGRWDHFWFVV